MAGLDHFGFIAPWYDRFASTPDPVDLLRLVDMPTGGSLLDAGGGTGRIAQAFTGKGWQIFLADASLRMASMAATKPPIRAACAAVEALPFPQAAFDRIIMVDALHHVASQTKTARELWRLLKPGGKLVIEEPDIASGWVKLIALGEKILLMRSRFLNARSIAALFNGLPAEVSIERKNHTTWVVITRRII
jgi:ubiquinone/menaquinone biosynthesis C-methylase UbiE